MADDVKKAICKDFCKAKKDCKPPLPIHMTGWSRGAMIVMGVAQQLNDDGCECGGFLGFFQDEYKPVYIRSIGLFDAVDMVFDPWKLLPGDQGFPNTVPGNVNRFAHAIKTDTTSFFQSVMLPTLHFGINERAFDNYDGTKSTHSDIGTSQTKNGAYDWIKANAIGAGAEF